MISLIHVVINDIHYRVFDLMLSVSSIIISIITSLWQIRSKSFVMTESIVIDQRHVHVRSGGGGRPGGSTPGGAPIPGGGIMGGKPKGGIIPGGGCIIPVGGGTDIRGGSMPGGGVGYDDILGPSSSWSSIYVSFTLFTVVSKIKLGEFLEYAELWFNYQANWVDDFFFFFFM